MENTNQVEIQIDFENTGPANIVPQERDLENSDIVEEDMYVKANNLTNEDVVKSSFLLLMGLDALQVYMTLKKPDDSDTLQRNILNQVNLNTQKYVNSEGP